MAAAFFLIAILVLAAPSAYAVQHVVGGSGGWSQSGDYATWAAGETFQVGDTLLFNYGSSHGVEVISQSDYDNCNTANAIDSYSGGKTTISLTQPGPMYFTCPTFGHCGSGMKLAINVVAANSTPATTPSGGSNPSPSTTPSTPSTSSPSSKGSSPNSAANAFGGINMLVVGFSLILAPVIAFMC